MAVKHFLLISLCLFTTNLCDNRDDKNRHNGSDKRHRDDPNIKRPENGTGPLLISYDNASFPQNRNRLLIVFDIFCINEAIATTNADAFIFKIVRFQQQFAGCFDLLNASTPHYDTANFSYVWLDIRCALDNITSTDSSTSRINNISIDYDDLCIEYMLYEPIFYTNQSNAPSTTEATPSHECLNVSTDQTYLYAQDLLDSPWTDGRYRLVDIETVVANDNPPFIAVIDSGIQADHVEFAQGQIVPEMSTGPASTVIGSTTLFDAHGTHVAGSVSGLRYGASRGFTIYDYKVCEFDEEGEVPCYTSQITDAMNRILTKLHADPSRRGVINLSLGGEKTFAMNDIYHSYFARILEAGGIPVVAAGNENIDACEISPAYSSNAITVGAFAYNFENAQREQLWFSNYGNCVDIWGPGENIYSAVPSASSNDRYGFLSGTSMATPLIAGIVANLLVVQPTLSMSGILSALRANATRVTAQECNVYECISPIYACDQRVFGDEVWRYQPPLFTLFEIVVIILVGVFVVILLITIARCCCRRRNNESPQRQPKHPSQKKYDRIEAHDMNVVPIENVHEQQAIIVTDAEPYAREGAPIYHTHM